MKQNQNARFSTAGFSLIELLVAMAIGLVLTGGLYQVFVGSNNTYSMNERFESCTGKWSFCAAPYT